jgi:hypothetical protein
MHRAPAYGGYIRRCPLCVAMYVVGLLSMSDAPGSYIWLDCDGVDGENVRTSMFLLR